MFGNALVRESAVTEVGPTHLPLESGFQPHGQVQGATMQK